MNLNWHARTWSALSRDELYACFQLRIGVFVIEQNCPYQDADGKDPESLHLFAMDDRGIVCAYLRVVAPGISFDEVSIGRVATDPSCRRTGIGRELMRRGMELINTVYGQVEVRISAQSYLKNFYESFAFIQESDEYLEDDIPHIEMLFTPMK